VEWAAVSSGNLKTLYVRELVNVGAHDERVDFVMARAEHVEQHFAEMRDIYHIALEDLTCLIEVEEGMEEPLPVAPTLRSVADIMSRVHTLAPYADDRARLKDLTEALLILAARFEETLDREDLQL
jgi:hypothetical protein